MKKNIRNIFELTLVNRKRIFPNLNQSSHYIFKHFSNQAFVIPTLSLSRYFSSNSRYSYSYSYYIYKSSITLIPISLLALYIFKDKLILEASDDTTTNQNRSTKGFKERTFIKYENRIRSFSSPEKIFNYFATIKLVYENSGSEIFMTPDDFIRAVTPGLLQPNDLGLDSFKKIEVTKVNQLDTGIKPDSIFNKLGSFGLISFSDFLFLTTFLAVSQRHFSIAFKMFDLNGDGNVDYQEFEKIQSAILAQTSIGKKLGKRYTYKGKNSGLAKYFFGAQLKEKLTLNKFLDFQKSLQDELLTGEFERKNPNPEGKISESRFGELLLTYANFSERKKAKMLARLRKMYPEEDLHKNQDRGIYLDDYLKFHHFLQNINDVDIALSFFNIAETSIDEDTLKRAARTVVNVDLRDHLIKVVFVLFDENEDGRLSNKEFISVMKERLRRGLNKPKDTGLANLLTELIRKFLFNFI